MKKLLLLIFGVMLSTVNIQADNTFLWQLFWDDEIGADYDYTFVGSDGNTYGILDDMLERENVVMLLCMAPENISATGTTIPATVQSPDNKTYSVITVSMGFLGVQFDDDNNMVSTPIVESIVIPGTVEFIYGTFSYETKLKSVFISEGVQRIGGDCFNECTSLASLTIPSSVTSFDDTWFSDCPSYMVVLIDSEISDDMLTDITNIANGRKVMKTDSDEEYYTTKFGIPPSYSQAVDYLTFCSPIPLIMSGKVKAFTGTVDGNVLKLKEVEGDVIPACTPVILKNDGWGKKAVEFYYEASTAAPIAGNDLKGVYEDTPTADLQVAGKVLCTLDETGTFSKYTGATLSANKAYLLVDEVAAAKGLRIELEGEGAATGITTLRTASDDAPVYNLQGQRVNGMQKGIVIKNGKKYFVK